MRPLGSAHAAFRFGGVQGRRDLAALRLPLSAARKLEVSGVTGVPVSLPRTFSNRGLWLLTGGDVVQQVGIHPAAAGRPPSRKVSVGPAGRPRSGFTHGLREALAFIRFGRPLLGLIALPALVWLSYSMVRSVPVILGWYTQGDGRKADLTQDGSPFREEWS